MRESWELRPKRKRVIAREVTSAEVRTSTIALSDVVTKRRNQTLPAFQMSLSRPKCPIKRDCDAGFRTIRFFPSSPQSSQFGTNVPEFTMAVP